MQSPILQPSLVEEPTISAIAHVIQLAVAPVFLLTGIAGILAVMTSRLARIIDRARTLEERIPAVSDAEAAEIEQELKALADRARLVGPAITFCTTTALLISSVIALLFLGTVLHFDTSLIVALLFLAAMTTFVLGLLWFLREIFVATRNLHIGFRKVHGRRGGQ